LVRDRRFFDLKFRRQHQIGDYIVDFYCQEKRLIVELDGAVHETEERLAKDHKRDAYLGSLGMDVIRIANDRLLSAPDTVLADIAERLNPLPLGEGRVRETKSRANEILFIDARNLGHLINRRTRELSPEDIKQISDTYHAWLSGCTASVSPSPAGRGAGDVAAAAPPSPAGRGAGDVAAAAPPSPAGRGQGEGILYEDIKGFCASVPLMRVAELDYVLTPGRYVGLPDEEDDFDFAERFAALKAEFEAQLKEEATLNKAIAENLARVKV
jgi:very-short-patch-repair endonuclease